MKALLLASAAAIALIAAPIATAQYTPQNPSPAAPTYSTPQTQPGYTLPGTGATASDHLAPTPQSPDAAPMPAPRVEAAPPSAYDTPNIAEAQPSDAPTTAEAEMADTVATATANAPATQLGREAEVSLASMQEHARDAGMESLPMSREQVCAPRSINFGQSSLNRDARHQLVAAVDRASVCDMRSVTIKAPESRAGAVRQALVAQGVDERAITVEDAAAGELEVDMAFNGIAASTPEFAAMFNGATQVASAEPNALGNPDAATPYADDGYAPTSYAPAREEGAPAYQPNGSDLGAPSATDQVYDPATTL